MIANLVSLFHCFTIAARADLRSAGRAGRHTPADGEDAPTIWSASVVGIMQIASQLLPAEITVREALERFGRVNSERG